MALTERWIQMLLISCATIPPTCITLSLSLSLPFSLNLSVDQHGSWRFVERERVSGAMDRPAVGENTSAEEQQAIFSTRNLYCSGAQNYNSHTANWTALGITIDHSSLHSMLNADDSIHLLS